MGQGISNEELDAMLADRLGLTRHEAPMQFMFVQSSIEHEPDFKWQPSISWTHVGPVIEYLVISVTWDDEEAAWKAICPGLAEPETDHTPRRAACRAAIQKLSMTG